MGELIIESGGANLPAAQKPELSLSLVQSEMLPASVIENAQKATTEVLSRVWSARSNPRNEQEFIEKMLKECSDPVFAEKAIYAVPVGGGELAEGPSIHLAKRMASAFRNFEWDLVEHGRVNNEVQYEVWAWDYEENSRTRQQKVVTIPHWAKTDVQAGREIRKSQAITTRCVLFDKLPGVQKCFEKAQQTMDKVAGKLAANAEDYLKKLSADFSVDISTLLLFCNLKDDDPSKTKGKPRKAIEKVGAQHIRRLAAIRTAILSEEIKAEDVWAGAQTPIKKIEALKERKKAQEQGTSQKPAAAKTVQPKESQPTTETKSKAPTKTKPTQKAEVSKKPEPVVEPEPEEEIDDSVFDEELQEPEQEFDGADDDQVSDENDTEEPDEQEEESEDEDEEEAEDDEGDGEVVQQSLLSSSTTKRKRPAFKMN